MSICEEAAEFSWQFELQANFEIALSGESAKQGEAVIWHRGAAMAANAGLGGRACSAYSMCVTAVNLSTYYNIAQ